MRKNIQLLFKNGLITTRKLSIRDFEDYFFVFKYIFKNNMIGIQTNDNPFWNPCNTRNQKDFYRDFMHIKKFNNKDNAYVRIINRLNFGDGYGISISE